MNVSRNVALPIMLTLTFASLLIAALTLFLAVSEFHQFDHLDREVPGFVGAFRSGYGAAWLLPVLSGGTGVCLLRRPECGVALFTWAVSVITIIICAWAAFAFMALYILHAASSYQI